MSQNEIKVAMEIGLCHLVKSIHLALPALKGRYNIDVISVTFSTPLQNSLDFGSTYAELERPFPT
ncbi:hypothetical protein PHMEG_00034078 [Phytophthora megakarya]|uniref:Uncharacterized protein n=1 Tax=Phytophthora megakarya TaxID=4795 RepID=A0A225UUD9_9STRA|nr:hypothetical protein PHMEG_00034078 [Phytophthora megakarya]